VSEPNPLSDPCMDPKQAQRIINKRRTAALSKFRSKVATLVSLVKQHGFITAGAVMPYVLLPLLSSPCS
jgi:hypothetical protein